MNVLVNKLFKIGVSIQKKERELQDVLGGDICITPKDISLFDTCMDIWGYPEEGSIIDGEKFSRDSWMWDWSDAINLSIDGHDRIAQKILDEIELDAKEYKEVK